MNKMIILTGPTAVGKTRLSIGLAKAVNGEIISADSMQVYRRMDIGSAKIRPEEMQGVPHHMIDIMEPEEPFNVVIFQEKCKECLRGIYDRRHVPVVTGGTGFYIQALLRDIDFTDEAGDFGKKYSPDDTPRQDETGTKQTETAAGYRAYLEELAAREGADRLHEMLREADPASAEAIHANNIKRTIRALEYLHLTGERISDHNATEREKPPAYNACYFVLNDDRDKIYAQIDRRVDEMLAQGLVDEVRRLKAEGCHRGLVSMQGLGYKEILSFLEGEIPLEEAVRLIKRDTRHFAKRQLTWFRRERDVIWVDKAAFGYDEDKILNYMLERCRQKGI